MKNASLRKKMHIKTDDMVMVISGTEKGKKGKVLEVSPKEGKVIVDKINIMTKHVKPRKQGAPSGLIKAEGPMYACKVMLYCQRCAKPVRAGHKITSDGDKVRICKKCGEVL